MPYRRRYGRRRRRRSNYKRRYRRYRRKRSGRRTFTPSIRKMPQLLPDKIKVRLRYVALPLLQSTGLTQLLVIRGNSLYDPNLTAAGHQPMYFDFWAGQYPNYYVPASTCKVHFLAAVDSTSSGYVAINRSLDSVSLPSTAHQMMEWPRSRSRLISIDRNSKSSCVLKQRCSTKKMFGFSMNPEDVSAPVTTNPTDQWFHKIFITTAGDGTTFSVLCKVTVVYDCVFYGRTFEPVQS